MYFDPECTIKRRVRYFFSAPDAELFPGGTVFSSSNWGFFGGPGIGPGEDPLSVRTYSKGQRPVGLDGTGRFCGDEDWFHLGVPPDTPPVRIVGGVPVCCVGNLYVADLGIKAGFDLTLPCQPMVNWAYVQMLYPDGTWRGPDNLGFALDPSWHIGQFLSTFEVFIEAFLSPGSPNCAQFRLFQWFRDREQRWPMMNMGPDPDHPGAWIWQGHIGFGTFQMDFRRSFRFVAPPYTAGLGLKLGLVSSLPKIVALGVELGLESSLLAVLDSDVGLQMGLESELSAIAETALGVGIGCEASLVAIVQSEPGVKVGLASTLLATMQSAIGSKLGLESSLAGTLPGSPGAKLGFASTLFPGISVPCCPGTLIPNTLHGTGSAGGAFSATYTSVSGGWPFFDPDSGFGFTLKCVSVGAGWQWQATNTQPGCTRTYTVQSLVCNPFALSCRTVLGGGSCVIAGTYNFTFAP